MSGWKAEQIAEEGVEGESEIVEPCGHPTWITLAAGFPPLPISEQRLCKCAIPPPEEPTSFLGTVLSEVEP